MRIVKLYSLNINVQELVLAVYVQTGIQFKYRMTSSKHTSIQDIFKTIDDFQVAIRGIFFEIETLFEDEANFEDIMGCSKENLLKKRADEVLTQLNWLRGENIAFKYKFNDYDAKTLQSISPPFYEWLKSKETI